MNSKRRSPGDEQRVRQSRRGFLKLLGGAAIGIGAAPIVASCNSGPRHVVAMTSGHQFKPAGLTIKKGTFVSWANIGSEGYSVVFDPSKENGGRRASIPSGAQPFSSPTIYPGDDWAHRFTTAGRYVYYAPQYPQEMIGTILVTEG